MDKNNEDSRDARWIVGYYEKENILRHAFIYPSRKQAMKEFAFDIESDPEMGTIFLAKIVLIQECEKIEKYIVKKTSVEDQRVISIVEYTVKDEGNT